MGIEMHKIESELTKVTKFRAKGKTGQALLKDLIRAVDNLKDEQWESLSTQAQKWVQKGERAIRSGKEVPEFPEVQGGDPEEKPTKIKSAKPDKIIDAPRPNATTIIMEMIIANPRVSTDEIMEKLQNAGYDPTRFFVATTKSNFKKAIKVIKAKNVDVRKLEL